jgi:AAA domain
MLAPGHTPLEPDRHEIEIFVDALFRHAAKQGFVSLRAFHDNSSNKVSRISPTQLTGGLGFLVDVAEDDARRAAQHPDRIVFCPPIATFMNKANAQETNILQALALSVECDAHPSEAREKLERLLGEATCVVRSGGRWTDPDTGQQHDKLHLHWRLAVPAQGPQALTALKEARRLATKIVGADASNVPACHPIRWPGSWHRKGEPALCMIETILADREIELDNALKVLRAAAPEPERQQQQQKSNGADRTAGPNEWPVLIAGVVSGANYHNATVRLAAMCVVAGMQDGATVNFLRGLMEATTGPRDERWQTRFDDLPRTVWTAREKMGRPAAAKHSGGLDVWNAGKCLDIPLPRGWLLGNSFCRRLVSALIAAGGAGKTALRITQAIALASGRELTGEHVFRRTRVLIVSLEDDRDELQRRVMAARLHHGVTEAELDGWLFLSAPGTKAGKLLTANPRTGATATGEMAAHIETTIVAHDIGLVIIDPLVKAHGVAENDNVQMDALAQLLTDIASKHDVAIDLPHHVSKGAPDPGNADRGRGASSMNNAARLAYTLSPMTAPEAERFGIPADDRRDFVRLDRAKLNVARSSGAAAWFRLISVQIGNATADYPTGDAVQAVETWTPPETWGGLDSALLNQILTAIDAGPGGGDFYTAASAATERAAWEVVHRFAPAKTEAACREIIAAWVKSGLLVKFDYRSPSTFKNVKGLRVDASKRPTAGNCQ